MSSQGSGHKHHFNVRKINTSEKNSSVKRSARDYSSGSSGYSRGASS